MSFHNCLIRNRKLDMEKPQDSAALTRIILIKAEALICTVILEKDELTQPNPFQKRMFQPPESKAQLIDSISDPFRSL
jgi:hypothetical protein